MLGSANSLSAAVVYAHYKTPMSRMLKQARYLMNELSKKKAGRGALALSHFSRNGLKTEFAMKWKEPERTMGGYQRFEHVREAFANKRLPNQLPYKLREMAHSISGALSQMAAASHGDEPTRKEARDRLLKGLFRKALSETAPSIDTTCAYELWRDGMRLFPENPERATEGLLLARALAGISGDALWD
jgi:CRISPR-associated protein Cmr2